jgi:hypothetical protein
MGSLGHPFRLKLCWTRWIAFISFIRWLGSNSFLYSFPKIYEMKNYFYVDLFVFPPSFIEPLVIRAIAMVQGASHPHRINRMEIDDLQKSFEFSARRFTH